MKKTLLRSLCVGLALAITAPAMAAPMHPQARDVSGHFSPYVQHSFTLLADSDDTRLVYYIPRQGGVAVQSPLSSNPIPRFAISSRYPSFGFWAGHELTHMGGTLSTTGDLGALQMLHQEAQQKGMRVTPAPVTKAGVKFLVAGNPNPVTGRIDVHCVTNTIIVNGREVRVPECHTRDEPDAPYDLSTNVMYTFGFIPLPNNGTVAQDLTFQATTLPDWAPQLRSKMMSGGQWDDVLVAKANWELRTSNLTRQARLTVNWRRLFEQASTFAAFHNYACVDVEIQAFFRRIIDCNNENACGIRVEYMQPNGTWGPVAPHDVNFVNAVNALERQLREELFNEMAPRLGRVSTRVRAYFTLRANYERLILERNEVRYFTYNPGPTDFEADTTLTISCLLGGFEEGRVRWNMDDPGYPMGHDMFPS
jgi:hypothetical protein